MSEGVSGGVSGKRMGDGRWGEHVQPRVKERFDNKTKVKSERRAAAAVVIRRLNLGGIKQLLRLAQTIITQTARCYGYYSLIESVLLMCKLQTSMKFCFALTGS